VQNHIPFPKLAPVPRYILQLFSEVDVPPRFGRLLGRKPAPPTASLLALEFGSGVFVSVGSLASEVILWLEGMGGAQEVVVKLLGV